MSVHWCVRKDDMYRTEPVRTKTRGSAGEGEEDGVWDNEKNRNQPDARVVYGAHISFHVVTVAIDLVNHNRPGQLKAERGARTG